MFIRKLHRMLVIVNGAFFTYECKSLPIHKPNIQNFSPGKAAAKDNTLVTK